MWRGASMAQSLRSTVFSNAGRQNHRMAVIERAVAAAQSRRGQDGLAHILLLPANVHVHIDPHKQCLNKHT